MAAIAEHTGSVVSAALFGALAGSGALPFPREAYEATIRAAGVGVEASLRAFAAARERGRARAASRDAGSSASAAGKCFPRCGRSVMPASTPLVARARQLPEAGARHGRGRPGARRRFSGRRLWRANISIGWMPSPQIGDRRADVGRGQQIARAMAYDDVIRVADLKTRDSRFARVRAEVAAKPDQIVYATEFMHPRMEEVCGTLAGRARLWIEASPRVLGSCAAWSIAAGGCAPARSAGS